MKRTKLRRLLPLLLTLLTVLACAVGITAAAETMTEEEVRSGQITNAGLVLDNNVDILFYVDITEETAQDKETFMTFNDGNAVYYSGMKEIGESTYACYRYNNVAPKDLAKVVTAKFYIGSTIQSMLDYSVKNYAQFMLTNSDSQPLKTLLSDLLVYGAESQALAGDDKDTYVTNGIVGLTPSEEPSDMIVLHGSEIKDNLARNEGVTIIKSKLSVTNGMELSVDLDFLEDTQDVSEYTVTLTVNGREQEVRVKSAGYFSRALLNAFYAYELFDTAEINVYRGNTRVSKTMSFSLASYLDALNNTAEYKAITNAYYNYSMSSHVYAGAHTTSALGELTPNGVGSSRYDDNGIISYDCSLCGQHIADLRATHIRDYESPSSGGNVANKGNSSNPGTLFTIGNATEALADGSSNTYYSIIRDLSQNTGSGQSFGYYLSISDARNNVIYDYVDDKGQYKGDSYTFSIDVKAPEAGLMPTQIYLQNTNTSDSTSRYKSVALISDMGAIFHGSTTIAPAGTVTSKEWTNITLTISFYTSNGSPFIYYEYYVNGELANCFSAANTLYDQKFTRIYVSASVDGLKDGQGIYLDNIVFAQGCVRSFYGSVENHVNSVDGANLRKVIDKIQNEFDIDQFSYVVRWDKATNTVYKEKQGLVPNPTNVYPAPEASPKSYDHPRLLFNSSDIPAIVENMHRPESAKAYQRFLDQVATYTDGKLVPTADLAPKAFEYTNYDVEVLRTIEAKALYYALFKNDMSVEYSDAELRGYEAIYAMKNCLLTFDVQWDMSDQCRMYGEIMYYTALVYDWCYDLLSDDDKLQFRLGVQNLCCDGTSNNPGAGTTHEGRKLEGGFPALAVEQQSALTGHGAEAQVLRDYFSFAIAIYDEDPTWYSYVGGMIYKNYIDARNYFYTSGYYPDGSAGYNVYRYVCDLYNAWLFKGMGVELPYNEEDMATVIHGLLAMEINDNFMFATADGSGTSSHGQYRLNTTVGDAALISSYLFDDNVALTIAERLCGYEYHRYGFDHQLGVSCAYYLILTSNCLTPAEDYREKISNVEYHGGFQQQVISRNNKDDDGVMVLSQGAQHIPGGHTHQNAGSFQIYYKGMLTRDDGLYDAYGSDHHFYYHMSGTAHNTLLIYNDDLVGSPVGPSNKTEYYNGAQKYELGVPVTYAAWIANEKFSFGKLIGMDTDDEWNPSYVYFANDITNAYDAETVDYVERSTMTLYTGDEETPMVMFIFDNITSDKASYQKTFLLQCVEEPTINGNVVTVDNGEGKLVLTSLLGADNIYAYGRTSKNGVPGGGDGSERFYLSGPGINLLPGGATSIGDKNSDLDIVWGHVEIQPDAVQATNHLMNVLYVSDSGTTVSATPELIEGEFVTGATFKNHTTVFVNDPMHNADILSFNTTGDGTMTYYVGGISNGTWKVTVNGAELGEFTAKEDGSMISFQAEAGEVVLTPGDDIRPAGTAPIHYNTNGGKLPADAPQYYFKGEVTSLPVPTKGGSTFEGWFTDKELTQPISEIPATATERYILYAKWNSPIVYADYTQGGMLSDYTEFAYNLESSGGSFTMVNNDDGKNYLLWNIKNTGSIITKDGKFANYADQSLKVSFVLSLGRNGSDQLFPVQLYLRNGAYESGTYRYMNVFKSDASGNLFLGAKTKIGQIPATGYATVRFVLDFETGKAYAYDENAQLIVTTSLSEAGVKLPPEYATYEDFYRSLKSGGSSLLSLKGGGAGSMRVGSLSVWPGDISTTCKNFGPTSTAHTWDEGVVIKEASTEDCTPGLIRYTCLKCNLTNEVSLISSNPHANIVMENVNGKAVYTCQSCNCYFSNEAGFVLDGTTLDNIIGVGNNQNFTTRPGTHQPVLAQSTYELINKTGDRGKLELWIPSLSSDFSGYGTSSGALGFISFKLNAFTDESFSFYLVDNSTGTTRWSSEWCIKDAFLTVSAPKNQDGKTTVDLIGWDGVILATIAADPATKFTGWVDFKACVEFDEEADTITLHYYANNEYIASATRALTTKSNAINSICVTGYTSTIGSGLALDDIAFGYAPNGIWAAPAVEAADEE